MVWFTNFVRPRLRIAAGQDDKDNINGQWVQCPKCETSLFDRRLARDLSVCHNCQHHFHLPLAERLQLIYGSESAYESITLPQAGDDPLRFRDTARYVDRLRQARQKTGANDAMTVVTGKLESFPLVTAAFNFHFIAGSMGIALGDAFLQACRLAVDQRAMLLVIVSSGGARMQEGIMSLMQMPRTIIGVRQVREARLPYIVLLTNPSTGGVLASLASLGDIHLAEPGAVIGFAGRRVIEQTVREKLPEDFQSAQYCLDHGLIDAIVPRGQLRSQLITLGNLLLDPSRYTAIAGTALE